VTHNHTFIETNGVRLHVVQAGADDAPLVILLHGFPEYWAMWEPMIQPLVEAGFRVWIPDQRGYNISDKPPKIQDYSLDVLADDLLGLLAAADVEKAILVAHDWGGGVAWWFANKFPQHVEKLIVINVPHHRALGKAFKSSWKQRFKSYYVLFFQLPLLPELVIGFANFFVLSNGMRFTATAGTFPRDKMQRYKTAWRQPNALKSMIHWYRAMRVKRSRLPYKTIQAPTLLLWGRQDAFFSQETAALSLDYCDAGRIRYIEGTHWVVDEHPEAVTAEIISFLNG